MTSDRDHDPAAALLHTEDARATAVHQLADAYRALLEAIDTYRAAWKAARDVGWAKTDLIRAGLLDCRRLPQIRRRTHTHQVEENR